MQNRTDTDKIKTIKNIVCDTINNEIDTESNNLPYELPEDTDKLIEMRHNELISAQQKHEKNENEHKDSWYYYFSSQRKYLKVQLWEILNEGHYVLALASNMDRAIVLNSGLNIGRKLYGYKKDTDSNSGGKRYQKNKKTKQNKTKQNKTKQNKTKQRKTKSKSKK